MPQDLSVSVSGTHGDISSLTFIVQGGAGNQNIVANTSDGGATWTAQVDGLEAGDYWIHAEATTVDSQTINSNWVLVKVE
jgi:hypothetical protein